MTKLFLKEYHIFEYNNIFLLLVIPECNWFEITKKAYDFLKDIQKLTNNDRTLNMNKQYIDKHIDIIQNLFITRVFQTKPLSQNIDGKNNYPIDVTAIQLHVSHHCNLGCEYCYANQGDYGTKAQKMDFKTACRAVDFLVEKSNNNKNIRISFFGGEPLTNFKLIKSVVKYAKNKCKEGNKKITFSMTTNGTLLSENVRRFVKNNKINLLVSIDGPEHIHNKYRKFKNGKNSHDVIKNNLIELNNQDFPVSVRATHSNTCDNICEFYKELNSLPIKKGFVSFASCPNDNYFKIMTEKNWDILKEEIKYLEEFYDIRFSPFYKFIQQFENKAILKYCCGGGRNFLGIAPTGGIYFCHRFVMNDNFFIGSVWDDFNKFSHSSVPDVEQREPCKLCWARYICGGQCYHESYQLFKNINNCEINYCNYMKSIIEQTIVLMSYIEKNEKNFSNMFDKACLK